MFRKSLAPAEPVRDGPDRAGADVINDGGRCSDEHDQGGDRDDKENMHLQQDTKLREVRAANSAERRCGFRAMRGSTK